MIEECHIQFKSSTIVRYLRLEADHLGDFVLKQIADNSNSLPLKACDKVLEGKFWLTVKWI